MPDLHDRLQDAAATDEAASLDMDDVRRRAHRHTTRRRVALAGSALAAVLLLGGVLVAVAGHDGSKDQHEGYVGTDDGRSSDPTGEWRRIPRGPLSPRSNSLLAWTGKEVLVIGGSGLGTCAPDDECATPPRQFHDAAAYDPAARTWRTIPGPPTDLHLGSEPVTVDGVVYVFAVRGPTGGTQVPAIARFDPGSDRWSDEPIPPVAVFGADRWPRRLAAWGHRLVVYVERQEGVGATIEDVVYDPSLDAWSTLPSVASNPQADRRMFDVGGRLLAIGIPIGGPQVYVPWRLVEHPAPRWEQLVGSSPTVGDQGASPGSAYAWVVHGHDLINLAPKPGAAVFEVDQLHWSWLPEPDGIPAAEPWPGYVVGGNDVAMADGRAIELGRLRWFPVHRPAGAPDDFESVWAGDRVIAWSGHTHEDDPAAKDLSNEGWEWTPPAFDPPRPGHISVRATGAVEGTAESDEITCDRDGPDMRTESWSGRLGDEEVELQVSRQIEGDLDGVVLTVQDGQGPPDEPRYGYLEHHVRQVHQDGTLSVDVDLLNMVSTSGVEPERVHLTAEWRCPD